MNKNQNDEHTIYEYLENILAQLPVSVYWMNKEFIYLGCTESMAHLLKLENRHSIVGKTYKDLYDKKTADCYLKADKSVMEKGINLTVEEPLYHPDGRKEIYLSKKVPLRNLQGEIIGMLGVSVDITERKKMEQELHSAKEAAEAANRAKTEFIANMSHDIRTPLTGVIGLSEVLEHSLQNPEDKEKAHLLHDSGEELLHMLNDILEDVGADHLDVLDLTRESFDLHACISDLVRLELPTTIMKNLQLITEIPPQVPQYIISDRKKIHRILLNLVGNAIKFTQTGHITIAVSCLHQNASTVHLKFSVADTGIGIPKALQAKIFDRFFRVSSSYHNVHQGHGLGLHIAQSYVALLGGHITLTSKEKVGSTFHFDFECSIGQPNVEPSPPVVALPKAQSAHILLVEDNVIALKTLELLLAQKGYKTSSVMSAEAALKHLIDKPVDVIITDVGLPGMSGTELAKAIHIKKGAVPIIGLTGHAKETAFDECQSSGMYEVLTKPVEIDLLSSVIDKCIKSH